MHLNMAEHLQVLPEQLPIPFPENQVLQENV